MNKNKFEKTFNYKLIYVFCINDDTHKNILKIGETSIDTDLAISSLTPNCDELNDAAKKRINEYTQTASIPYQLLYTELAIKQINENGKIKYKSFSDKDVHNILIRSNISKHDFKVQNQGIEWFETDLETVKSAISAVKQNQSSLDPSSINKTHSAIIFRPEQQEAIKKTINQFKIGNKMLWNAKMRFGKTLTALELTKRMQFKRTLILTHKPVVNSGWYDDFNKIFNETNYKYGSKNQGEKIENLIDNDNPFIYFASLQDLRGSSTVGGKYEKNEFIFASDWDFVIVDEAHEGTKTDLGQKVIETVKNNQNKIPKLLELSGTPFNLISDFKNEEIYTWDYIMEQKAKRDWALNHFCDSNPYEELPMLEIFTYDIKKYITSYIDEDSAFNFKEFFRTWTGDVQKDYKIMPLDAKVGDFVHKDDILAFLNLLTKKDNETNYTFSKEEYRNYYRHTLWIVPGVKEAKALSELLKQHECFKYFNIVNVAGNGDEESEYENNLQGVKDAISNEPDKTYSITISCGRLTTGVTVPEWTAVFYLAGSFNTSASSYLQTIFRVQTPANINGKIKERCSVFDFAPDRALKMACEVCDFSSKAGKLSDKSVIGDFLNYCPIISIDGSSMQTYNTNKLLQQLKKVYTDKVVKNGFDDTHIYNENLLKLNEIELKDFDNLKKIIGATKQPKKINNIEINNQGFSDEEYEKLENIEKKPKKELTLEEQAFLEEKKKKKENAKKAILILRAISIRIPLLIYGADVNDNEEITVNNFADKIDDISWKEFMPDGVTKDIYKKFKKYYDEDIFVAAGNEIRKRTKYADSLSPTERVIKIAEIFSTFKNPDKETVLTPWKVINMHLGNTLGGYNFYDENYEKELSEQPRFIDLKPTKDTLTKTNAKILDINSKTGLYSLYAAYSIYMTKINKIPLNEQTIEKQNELWKQTIRDNIYVICKTNMAKFITRRTLIGYKDFKINAHAFDNLISQLTDKSQQFKEKILRPEFWNRKENEQMKFDAIVGNPPYQNGHQQIYVYFYLRSIEITNNYVTLIFPCSWQEPKTANGLDKLNKPEIKTDKQIVFIDNRQNVFEGISGAEWVNIILWQKGYDNKLNGLQNIYTNGSNLQHKKLIWDQNEVDKPIELKNAFNLVKEKGNFESMQTITSRRNPYGLTFKKDEIISLARERERVW